MSGRLDGNLPSKGLTLELTSIVMARIVGDSGDAAKGVEGDTTGGGGGVVAVVVVGVTGPAGVDEVVDILFPSFSHSVCCWLS